jgi:hypothetical protein
MELPGDYAEFERFNIELTTYRSELGAILRSQGIDGLGRAPMRTQTVLRHAPLERAKILKCTGCRRI